MNLHQAAARGRLEVVRRLLAAGEDVNGLDAAGRTPLHFAAAKRRREIVRLLLESGADPDGLATAPLAPTAEEDEGPGIEPEDADQVLSDEDDNRLDDDEQDEEPRTACREPPLLAACEHHKHQAAVLEVVRLLIAAGANVNAIGQNGVTPLMMAAWREWPEVLETLLAAGADVELADDEGVTPLLAALSVDTDRVAVTRMVRALLAAGSDIQHADEEGQTPLMLAAAYGHVDLVRTLLDMGADADAEDLQERNSLARAAESLANLADIGRDAGLDLDEILAGLEEFGIDPDSDDGRRLVAAMRNRHGPGSLAWTCGEIESEEQLEALRDAATPWLNQIVELLVEHGCRLDHAAQYLVKAGREDLLQSASALNTPNALGQTALTEAVAEGAVDRVRRLLAIGADPNARNYFDQSPLECVPATRRGRECGRLLVEAGADLNARSPNGLTELENALQSGGGDKVRLLLEWGADVRVGAPLLWAVRLGDLPLLKLLLERRADPGAALAADGESSFQGFLQGTTPLMRAAADQPQEVLQLLLDAGADVEAQDHEGRTAVDVATRHGRYDIARWLQERGGAGPDAQSYSRGLLVAAERGQADQARAMLAGGADPNVRGAGGLTPLILAAREGHEGIVEMLLGAGADVNARSEPGYSGGHSTALRCAVVREHAAIVKRLLKAGADPRPSYEYSSIPAERENTVVASIGTALHDAARSGQEELVEWLLAAGSDANAVDPQDETPLVTAVRQRHWQVAGRLLSAGARRREQDAAFLAPLEFPAAASRPEFAASIRLVEQITGTTAESRKEIPGLAAFTIIPDGAPPIPGEDGATWDDSFAFSRTLDAKMWRMLDAGYASCLERGHLLLHHSGLPACGKSERRHIHLLPTADKYAALGVYHVRGNEVELSTADIIAWLRDFERDHPFRLRGAGFDVVELEFTVPLAHPESVARRLVKFCPDLIEQNFPSWAALIQHLTTTHRVHLWWD